ncbi:hypothetical protein DRW41_17585 [Neobacillus piezotolerans]|uniref:Uncharacterized protein n=1 Tax=Neobacillus piezotolerans TaxID=2259171 RepID=A0A3D8GMU0_9BACI|nr:hypothetical protein DRW41_17585 [Neobacillus piezotolerans]
MSDIVWAKTEKEVTQIPGKMAVLKNEKAGPLKVPAFPLLIKSILIKAGGPEWKTGLSVS